MRPAKPLVKIPSSIFALPKRIKFITLTAAIYSLGWAIVLPFWSIYFQSKLPNLSEVGVLLAIQPILAIFWALFWGKLSNKFSKRSLIAVILLFYTPFSFIVLALSDFWEYALFFVYHSFIATILWLAFETYLRTHAPKDKEAQSIGLFDSGWAVAYILGSSLGGFLFFFFSLNSIYAVSFFSILAFFMALFLPDRISEKMPASKTSFMQNVKNFIKHSELFKLSLITAISITAGSLLGMLYPLLLKSLGASPIQIGFAYALINAPILLEGYFCSLNRTKKGIIISIAVISILFLSLTVFNNIYLLFVITLLIAIIGASVTPFAQGRVMHLIPKKSVSEFTSVTFSINQVGAAMGPLLGGFFADLLGLHFVFIIGFMIYAGIAAFLIFSKKTLLLRNQ